VRDRLSILPIPQLLAAIRTSWYAFEKYYSLTGDVTAYGVALLLAPQRRCQYIERNWKNSWIPTIINNARKLWQDEYKNLPRPAKARPAPVIRELDEYDLWEREQTVMISHLDEFDRFSKGDPIPLPNIIGTSEDIDIESIVSAVIIGDIQDIEQEKTPQNTGQPGAQYLQELLKNNPIRLF
jgi:hypothetical protein